MLADLFQKTVLLPDEQIDASLSGALQIAAETFGLPQIFEKRPARRIEPDTTHAETYADAYGQFRLLVEETKK
jgi:sugar (pentulose or hexulose) kinase